MQARIKALSLAKSPALPNEEFTERIVRPEGLPCKGNSDNQMMVPQAAFDLSNIKSKLWVILILYICLLVG